MAEEVNQLHLKKGPAGPFLLMQQHNRDSFRPLAVIRHGDFGQKYFYKDFVPEPALMSGGERKNPRPYEKSVAAL